MMTGSNSLAAVIGCVRVHEQRDLSAGPRGAPPKRSEVKHPKLAKTTELNSFFMRQLTFLDR
jgi:hypothetical protein